MGVDGVQILATPWKRFLMWLFKSELEQVRLAYITAMNKAMSDSEFCGQLMQKLDSERIQYWVLLERLRQSPPVTPTEQARADAMVREHRLAEKARKDVQLMRQRGWSTYTSNEHNND